MSADTEKILKPGAALPPVPFAPSRETDPAAYARGTAPSVSAKFRVEPQSLPPGAAMTVRAQGPDGISVPATAAALSGGEAVLQETACSGTFPGTVKYYSKDGKGGAPAFKLDWEASLDGGSTWAPAGETRHTVYVTLAQPHPTALKHETLYYIGCRYAAGETTVAGMTSSVWDHFAARDVRRVDGVQLTYYNSYNTEVMTTADLLAYGDGQCGSWARFFLDTLKIHGFREAENFVLFKPSLLFEEEGGFIVKNWTFSGDGWFGGVAGMLHPYLNIPSYPLVGSTQYNWLFKEVNYTSGTAGQGNAKPAALFGNHQVAFVQGKYYDPSYGQTFATLQDIDNGALDGFWMIDEWDLDESELDVDIDGDGGKTDWVRTPIFLFRKNPAGLDLKEYLLPNGKRITY